VFPIYYVWSVLLLISDLIELGGDEDWVFEYTDVVEGENARFKDIKAKKGMAGQVFHPREHLEERTRAWISTEDEETELERETCRA